MRCLGSKPAGVVDAIGSELSGSVVDRTTRERRNGMTPDTSRSQTHRHEVARPDPSDTRAYLEQLTKAVFRAGLNWKVVENKWPGFMEAFHDFDPEYVADLSPKQVGAIEENAAV